MDGYGKCHECVKFGTMECPTSSKCMAFDERPFFEPKPRKKNLIDKIKEKISTIWKDGHNDLGGVVVSRDGS